MSDLNEFLKVLAEGKKVAEEKNVGKKFLRQLQESLHNTNPFEPPKEPELEIEPPLEVEVIAEEVIQPEPEVIAEVVDPLQEIDKLLRQQATAHTFQQPNPDKIDPNIRAVQDKLKFLEQWLGKIAATGPGGGAGEIYNLDMPTRQVTGDYTINRKDYYIGVNCDVKSYITLPTAGRNLKNGRVVVIKDESGHAQLTPIKIVGTIDNDPNGAEIRINNGAVQLIYRDGWRII